MQMAENLSLIGFCENGYHGKNTALPQIDDPVAPRIQLPKVAHAGEFLRLTGWERLLRQSDQIVQHAPKFLAVLLVDGLEVASRPRGKLDVVRNFSGGAFRQRT